MPTRDYKETVRYKVKNDSEFREALLKDAIDCLLSGDVETGKGVLRDYIRATSGFKEISRTIDKKPETVIRMLGPRGNPTADNLFQIIAEIQNQENIHLEVELSR